MAKEKAQAVRLRRVIDGDTVEVELNGGWLQSPQPTRIRLWGIDAPEASQPLGAQATKGLQKLLGSRRRLYLEIIATDQYQRVVGVLHPDPPSKDPKKDQSYNRRMLAAGWAYAYMLSGPRQQPYQEAEAQARQRRRGVWKAKAGSKAGEVPRAYRQRRQRQAAAGRRWRWYLLALLALALLSGYAWWFIDKQLLPGILGS